MRRKAFPQPPAGSLGVVYLCFGKMYREFTALSISQLRRLGYSGPIRVLSDRDSHWFRGNNCEFVRVRSAGEGFASRHYKTQINKYGWDTTLFLDADAIPIAPINHIWRELRFADLCLSMDLHPTVEDLVLRSAKGRERRQAEFQCMYDMGLMQNSFFSSGVMLFRRSPAVERLFSLWHDEWNRFQDEDQLALVRALSRVRCRIHTLAPRWNARLSRYESVRDAQLAGVRVLHLRPSIEIVPAELLEATA